MGIDIVNALSQTLQPELYMDGEFLIREGEEGDDMFVVVSGGIAIQKGFGKQSNELARLGRGAAVGELALQGRLDVGLASHATTNRDLHRDIVPFGDGFAAPFVGFAD